MQNINYSDMRKIDLNLVLVFCAIHSERSVSGAAGKLYLTQPAISASLARLRGQLGDALFVREGRKLRPTPFSDRLALTWANGLSEIQTGFLEQERFDPKTSRRVFRLGLLDDLEVGILPPLMSHLRKHAPNIGISVRTSDFRTLTTQIERDEIDLALGVFDDLPKSARRKEVLRTSFRTLFNPKLLQISERFSLKRYLELDHVIISFRGDFHSIFEEKYSKKGVFRNIVMSSPRFSAIPYIVKESPVIASLPEYLAYRFARNFGLATVAAPFIAQSFGIEQVWPNRLDQEAGHVWFRMLVTSLMRMNTLIGQD
jgi:LysR family transcriptional regulator, mexEF-oprN operon transcriptional activator